MLTNKLEWKIENKRNPSQKMSQKSLKENWAKRQTSKVVFSQLKKGKTTVKNYIESRIKSTIQNKNQVKSWVKKVEKLSQKQKSNFKSEIKSKV